MTNKHTPRSERPAFSGVARAEEVYEEQEEDRRMWEFSAGMAMLEGTKHDLEHLGWG